MPKNVLRAAISGTYECVGDQMTGFVAAKDAKVTLS